MSHTMQIGDALLLLGSIEHQARLARETLTQATIVRNSPDPLAMPGQPPRPRNADIANSLLQQHHAHMGQLAAVTSSLFSPRHEPAENGHENGVIGRIGNFPGD